jgi:prepilin-type N-terminal cleavage/methylation domain-containing protein
MIRREAGFTLVELMVTMVIFVFFIAAASSVFTGLLTQFKQQSKISETNIEGIIGLGILRQDIESAGYGLPWNGLISYSESSTNPYSLNDSTTTAAPRAILSENNATFSSPNNIFDGSDYLVIKSVGVAQNEACQKWTTLGFASPYVRTWTPASENKNLADTDRVIVLSPGSTDANGKTLIVSGSNFFTTFQTVENGTAPWTPTDTTNTYVVYGIKPYSASNPGDPRMPFNRADYVIRRFDSSGTNITPSRCAPNTGVLEKAVVNHSDGGFTYLPLLDCVADMQVIFGLDTNNNGIIGTYTDGDTDTSWPPGAPDETADHATVTSVFGTAASLRQGLMEVRIYILAHEGQRDANYTYPNSTIVVGDSLIGDSLGNTFNLATKIGDPEYKYYRWKLYTIVVKPSNLK